MHELALDDPYVMAGVPLAGSNLWPESLEGFRETITSYNDVLVSLSSGPIVHRMLKRAE